MRFGLGLPRVRSLVETELKARRVPPAPDMVLDGGVFTDRHGVRHPLDLALRDRLKPEWRSMLDPVAATKPPTDEVLANRARKAVKVVAEASELVAATTGLPLTGRILEVGCYDGAAAFQLARRPGTEVVASDLARYYLVQRPGTSVDADLAAQQTRLADIRERARVLADLAPGTVGFVEDDITRSDLPSASFDAIVSFEVLEHVQDPLAAFAGMARLLRPGGVVYHDYNPFFSANGGHSLCTLDLPWGHARLDADDFERYVQEIRPSEVDQALRFYHESLNRMTQVDLRAAITAAGLETVAVVPWFDRRLVPRLDAAIIAEVRRTYPTAVVDDLLATFVAVVARRRPAPDGRARPES
ncbi:MAG: class I SAM-dependent methyltransferase [Chloroflexota bacterium]